jgi:hypothetical protein
MFYKPSRQQLENRLYEIDQRITHATAWGALLSVLSEERKNIEAELRRLDSVGKE